MSENRDFVQPILGRSELLACVQKFAGNVKKNTGIVRIPISFVGNGKPVRVNTVGQDFTRLRSPNEQINNGIKNENQEEESKEFGNLRHKSEEINSKLEKVESHNIKGAVELPEKVTGEYGGGDIEATETTVDLMYLFQCITSSKSVKLF